MRAFAPLLIVLPTALAGLVAPGSTHQTRDVSPDLTCGKESGFNCPASDKCCSKYGFCGSDDSFCLTTAGCQADYSNSTSDCHEPKEGVSVSVDGTCGTTGAGKEGYVCPSTGESCCSGAGYCGNTTSHCSVVDGCQAGFGICSNSTNSTGSAGNGTSNSSNAMARMAGMKRSLPVRLFV